MRNKKYRAWIFDPDDITDGWMTYKVFLMLHNEIYFDGDIAETDETIIWMENICLKNIWEGDIISDNVGKGIIEYSENHAAFRVNYIGSSKCKFFYDYLESELKTLEVIGNKFENPELLEVSNE